MTQIDGHGGDLALAALRGFGVEELFTLSGAHVFPLYDAAHKTGVRIVDVRHEQSAVFAAEAVAKLQRRPGLAVLTAGPGVTNGVSGLTSASFNGAPVVVIGGRAPQFRWGSGSLQEMDHLPIVRAVTKHAETILATDEVYARMQAAALAALTPHRGRSSSTCPWRWCSRRRTGSRRRRRRSCPIWSRTRRRSRGPSSCSPPRSGR